MKAKKSRLGLEILSFFAIGLFAVVGCTKKSEPQTAADPDGELARQLTPPKDPVAAEPGVSPTPPGICPGGMAPAGSHPRLKIDLPEGARLVVCGWDRADEFESPKLQMTGFDVFRIDAKGKASKAIATASELDNYYVTIVEQKLVLEELFYSRESWRTVFRTTIACEKEACVRSEEVCAFDRKALEGGEILRSEVRSIRGKVRAAAAEKKRYAFDEMEIWPLLEAAMTGDAEAKRFFESFPPKEGMIDGASAEAFREAQALLKRTAKCP